MTQPTQAFAEESTRVLQLLMKASDIASYRALAECAGVSRWQVKQLRSGNIDQMRVVTLSQIAGALDVSLESLLQSFPDSAGLRLRSALGDRSTLSENQLAKEQPQPQQVQPEQAQQEQTQQEQFQRHALQTIETWLTQWATISKRAQERGDALPAAKILPFVRPVQQLMSEWDVVPFAAIDEQIPYDPQRHQLTKGTASPGDPVQVTHVGHTHRGKLLHRAKVKPIS